MRAAFGGLFSFRQITNNQSKLTKYIGLIDLDQLTSNDLTSNNLSIQSGRVT
jgi:hypothetical protein